MDKSLNEYTAIYKAQLKQGTLQHTYRQLVGYVMALRAHFEKHSGYRVGNVSPGYMDFTYFPFFNDFLRARKLRFGLVLNHGDLRFELWLMGQNAAIQAQYWELLRHTEWNRRQPVMPRYAALETILMETPDFDDLDALTSALEKAAMRQVGLILPHIP